MASPIIKSTFLLLITTIAFSSYEVVEAGFFDQVGKIFIKVGAEVLPHVIQKGFEKGSVHVVKMSGEKLAVKFFGPGARTGFRWGWRAGKYYLKIDKSCQEYNQYLAPYCNFSSSHNPTPVCGVIKCIVITATSAFNQTTAECDNSCNENDPEEAKCDETLNKDECEKLIGG